MPLSLVFFLYFSTTRPMPPINHFGTSKKKLATSDPYILLAWFTIIIFVPLWPVENMFKDEPNEMYNCANTFFLGNDLCNACIKETSDYFSCF